VTVAKVENPTSGRSPMYGQMRFISQQEWDLTKCGDTRLHGLNSHVASRPEGPPRVSLRGQGTGKPGKTPRSISWRTTYARLSNSAGADGSLCGVCMELPSTLL
jgi:hypothetical protein